MSARSASFLRPARLGRPDGKAKVIPAVAGAEHFRIHNAGRSVSAPSKGGTRC